MSRPEGTTTTPRGKRAPTGPILLRREMVAFLPAVALAGLWFGLAPMVLLGATAIVVAWMTRPVLPPPDIDTPRQQTGRVPLPREAAEKIVTRAVSAALTGSGSTACLVLGPDEPTTLEEQIGHEALQTLHARTLDRLRGALREGDGVARLDATRFAVVLKPTLRLDLESLIQLSVRLQNACEEPVSLEARSVTASFHVGFCLLDRAPAPTANALLAAAERAADEARRNGPSGIRAFSPELHNLTRTRSELADEIEAALEDGQITAFFEPQLNTSTGAVSGMQAVPRWLHPERGLLTDEDIYPAADAAQLRERLTEVLIFQSFNALRNWDARNHTTGPVALLVSASLMANPRMAERLKWDCDRFNISPSRLRLVLRQEAVTKIDDEIAARSLAACTAMGCEIELAGFGQAPATVSSIRRSGAKRVRIDRSFIARVERDREQQRTVAAIVSFAEGLGLETLADGVGSIAAHAMLAQLGCGHVQGRAISPPLAFDETLAWLDRHDAKLARTPKLPDKSA